MRVLNRTFKFLPTARKYVTLEMLLTELKENVKKINANDENAKYQLELSSIIIDKLASEEWKKEDYDAFYKAISQTVNESYPNISLQAIIEIFSKTEEELKEDLGKIEENTKHLEIPFYPYRELVLTETKKQVMKISEYDKMDAFKMVGIILSKMSIHQSNTTKSLFKEKNRLATLELLTEIIEEKREDDSYLKDFDQEFSYLGDIESFKCLYLTYREAYIRLVRKNFMSRCELENLNHINAQSRSNSKLRNGLKAGGYYKTLRQKERIQCIK